MSNIQLVSVDLISPFKLTIHAGLTCPPGRIQIILQYNKDWNDAVQVLEVFQTSRYGKFGDIFGGDASYRCDWQDRTTLSNEILRRIRSGVYVDDSEWINIGREGEWRYVKRSELMDALNEDLHSCGMKIEKWLEMNSNLID